MAKQYALRGDGYITRTIDGATIPPDQRNSDYRAYLAWLAAGNTPDPVPPTLKEGTDDLGFGPSILELFGG